MGKIFDFDARKGSLLDSVSNTQGVLTDGKFCKTEKGYGVQFDGSSTTINYGNINNISNNDFSINIIAKFGSDNIGDIYRKRSGDPVWLRIINVNGYIVIETAVGKSITSVNLYGDNKYHNILITKTGTVVNFYVDNIHDITGVVSENISNSGDVVIGGIAHYKGSIALVAFYDTILTQQERNQLYIDFLNSYSPIEVKRPVYLKPTDLSYEKEDSLGTNVIKNGDFTDGVVWWGVGGASTITNNNARLYSPDGAISYITQPVILTVGIKYILTYDVISQYGCYIILRTTSKLQKKY